MRVLLAVGLLVGALYLAGCIEPSHLDEAKKRYNARYGIQAEETKKSQADGGAPSANNTAAPVSRQHKPYREQRCADCHDLKRSFALREKGNALCFTCHDKKRFTGANVHQVVAAGQCTVCHDPHEGKFERLLKIDPKTLCNQCHGNFQAKPRGSVHQPVAEGNCLKCHDPHKGSAPALLKQEVPRLCVSCHREEEFKRPFVHGPLNVGDCQACHEPHASNWPVLARGSLPDEVCFICHNRDEVLAPSYHQEFRTGGKGCLDCHSPHAGADQFFLKDKDGEASEGKNGAAGRTGKLAPAGRDGK